MPQCGLVPTNISELNARNAIDLAKPIASSLGFIVDMSVCGCYGEDHEVWSNCIECGRIHCVLEKGYVRKEGTGNACRNCGAQVTSRQSAASLERNSAAEVVAAYRMKDKLLNFDKEHAKRQHVYDAQGDYYKADAWLTEEEKIAADVREKARRKALNVRGRAKGFQVFVDLAGRVVVKDILEGEDSKGDDDLEEEETGEDDAGVQGDPGSVAEPLSVLAPGLFSRSGNVGRAATVLEALHESVRGRQLDMLERRLL